MNKLGINLDKGIKKPNILYISNALISATCGCLLSLAMMLVTDNLIVWIMTAMIGTFMGTKSYKFALRVLLLTLDFFKNTDFSKVIDELDGEEDIEAVSKLDNERKDTKTPSDDKEDSG